MPLEGSSRGRLRQVLEAVRDKFWRPPGQVLDAAWSKLWMPFEASFGGRLRLVMDAIKVKF